MKKEAIHRAASRRQEHDVRVLRMGPGTLETGIRTDPSTECGWAPRIGLDTKVIPQRMPEASRSRTGPAPQCDRSRKGIATLTARASRRMRSRGHGGSAPGPGVNRRSPWLHGQNGKQETRPRGRCCNLQPASTAPRRHGRIGRVKSCSCHEHTTDRAPVPTPAAQGWLRLRAGAGRRSLTK